MFAWSAGHLTAAVKVIAISQGDAHIAGRVDSCVIPVQRFAVEDIRVQCVHPGLGFRLEYLEIGTGG